MFIWYWRIDISYTSDVSGRTWQDPINISCASNRSTMPKCQMNFVFSSASVAIINFRRKKWFVSVNRLLSSDHLPLNFRQSFSNQDKCCPQSHHLDITFYVYFFKITSSVHSVTTSDDAESILNIQNRRILLMAHECWNTQPKKIQFIFHFLLLLYRVQSMY